MDEEKKVIKRSFNYTALILIVYTLLFSVFMGVSDMAVVSLMSVIHPEMSAESIMDFAYYSGHSLIAAAVGSVAAAFLCARQKPSFKSETKIDFKTIIWFFVLIEGLQVICSYAFAPVGYAVSMLGGSLDEAASLASDPSIYFSGIVYSVIVAPIAEELFCRGLLMKRLEPYGKGFAVIMSALLFGLIHFNIVQFLTTFVMGIVFGYIDQRYSLGAAVLLHMLNNLFVELMGNLEYVSDAAIVVYNIFMCVSFAFAVVMLVRNRDKLRMLWRENKPDGFAVKCFFASPVMLITILYFAFMTLLSITPA